MLNLCACKSHEFIFMLLAESFRRWLSMAVARSIAAALAPSTSGQYAGAAHIFIMFCMYVDGGEDNVEMKHIFSGFPS